MTERPRNLKAWRGRAELTVGEQRIWKLSEKRLEQTADDVEVAPFLERRRRREAGGADPWGRGGRGDTHVFLDVRVRQAFAVELLLHAGDGGVVAGDPVDARVLQAALLHHLTAHLHNQRNKLQDRGQARGGELHTAVHGSGTPTFAPDTHPVGRRRGALVQPHPKHDPRWSLFLKGPPHDSSDAKFPGGSVSWWTGLIWQVRGP